MHDTRAIELKAGGIEQKYRILKSLPRSYKGIESIIKDLHADLTRRESDALRRTQEVEDFITGNQCLALALAKHFGMGLPDGKLSCGSLHALFDWEEGRDAP